MVVGDTLGDDFWGDMESGGDSGCTSHIGDNWLASEEASDGKARRAEGEVCLDAFFVELGAVDTESGGAGSAVA